MGISDFLKDKVDKGKKAAIKFRIKSVVKNKISLNEQFEDIFDRTVDKAVDKIGADNIIKAAKYCKTLKK